MERYSQIYEKLMDEESRQLYKLRLRYSQTNDYREICQIVAHTKEAKAIRSQISKFPKTPVFIWGTGFWGNYILKGFPEIHWAGYIDSFPKESRKDGLPILNPEEFRNKYHDAVILIATIFCYREIYDQLLSWNYDTEKIINAGKIMEGLFDRQYFDLPHLSHEKDEIFVDAGCFDGLTVKNFIKWSGGNYREIIALEPDRECFEVCKKQLRDVERLKIIDKGLWSKDQVVSFHATGSSDSSIAEDGEREIRTVCLDEIVKDKRVTFLKMDIEGAEREALIGASETIRVYKPKLAISIYHKPEDIWEIPQLILDFREDYRFYIRHYSLREAETVLYAI